MMKVFIVLGTYRGLYDGVIAVYSERSEADKAIEVLGGSMVGNTDHFVEECEVDEYVDTPERLKSDREGGS